MIIKNPAQAGFFYEYVINTSILYICTDHDETHESLIIYASVESKTVSIIYFWFEFNVYSHDHNHVQYVVHTL